MNNIITDLDIICIIGYMIVAPNDDASSRICFVKELGDELTKEE